jgi:hypothetical protein
MAGVLKAPSPDGWTSTELARFRLDVGSTRMLEPDDVLAPSAAADAGHNGPPPELSFDDVVAQNRRQLYIAQLRALLSAVKDPRLIDRDVRVFAYLIEHTNNKSGLAYPGRARMAEEIVHYVNGEAQRYTEQGIANSILNLTNCGYLLSARRAPEGSGRALAHYATTAPTVEQLQAEVTKWCQRVRSQPRRRFPKEADVTTGSDVRKADVTSLRGADVTSRCETVTGTRITGRGKSANAPPPEPNGKASLAAALGGQAAFAYRNVLIADSGKVSIGEEFRAELRETYTDSQIERGLERAPSQCAADPLKLLAQIRRCCSYAKQDDEKAAAGKTQSTRRTLQR